MSADNRTVATDALATLGTKIDMTQKRDAIHLAVIPVTAMEKLYPGQDVCADGTLEAAGGDLKPIGLVDPFLKSPVFPGETFWLVIYPRVITSLRHVWTHPAISDEPEQVTRSLDDEPFVPKRPLVENVVEEWGYDEDYDEGGLSCSC